ncbi:MAG: PepSY-associated TM helix domain-containing protein [Methylophagaceae bacterium]
MNRRLRSLHRSIGATVALFVLLLAITGIMLNHTTDLKLDQRYLTWDWLLEHYGLGFIQADSVYLLDQTVVSQFGTQIFIDATPITKVNRPLLGGVSLDDIMVLATDDALLLLTPEGEFIERISEAAGIPPEIQNIGLFHGEPVLQTREGLWRSDFMLDRWEQISLQGVGWSLPQPMPDSIEQEIASYFHGKGVTIEHVVLDLHNGRIIGKAGIWLLDILAILMIFLALTGLWIWARRA